MILLSLVGMIFLVLGVFGVIFAIVTIRKEWLIRHLGVRVEGEITKVVIYEKNIIFKYEYETSLGSALGEQEFDDVSSLPFVYVLGAKANVTYVHSLKPISRLTEYPVSYAKYSMWILYGVISTHVGLVALFDPDLFYRILERVR